MDITSHKAFAILSSFLFLALAYFTKKKIGTFIFPSSLMSLAWFFYTFIPLLFLYKIPINPLPILYIFVCVLAFNFGALPFNWNKAFQVNKLKSNYSKTQKPSLLIWLFFLSIFYSIFFTTLVLIISEISLYEIITNPRWAGARFAFLRSEGRINYDLYGILSILFTYLSPTLGSLAFYNYPQSKKRILFMSIGFIPPIYLMITQSSKLIFFFSIAFFLAGLLLSKIHSNNLELFNKKFIPHTLIAILMTVPFLIFSFSTRNSYAKINDITASFIHSIQSYSLAQPYAFADFFSFHIGHKSILKYQNDLNSFGSYTFTSIYNSFGKQKKFPIGTFFDFYKYENQIQTNIFTIFRGLVNDFGIYGTLIYMYISGIIAHYFYFLLLTRKSHIASAIFIITIVYIQGTYLASVFMARYIYLVCASLIFIFWLNDKYEEKFIKTGSTV